jgi:hypothetical protein
MIENGDGHVKSSTKAIKIRSTNFESIVNLSESDSDEIFFDAEEPNSPKFRFEFFFEKMSKKDRQERFKVVYKKCLKISTKKSNKI